MAAVIEGGGEAPPLPRLVIESEEDALQFLELALKGEAPEVSGIDFENWPVFRMDVKGADWHSSVPTRVMKPLLELQGDIHRAYLDITRGTDRRGPGRISDEVRDDLELVIEVRDGSSDYLAIMAKQFGTVAKEAFTRMSGQEAMITVLGVALLACGAYITKEIVRSRLERVKARLSIDEQQIRSDERIAVGEQHLQAQRLLIEALNNRPILVNAQQAAEETANALLKTAKPADQVILQGTYLNGVEANEITRPAREAANDTMLEGTFRVVGNKTERAEGFRLSLVRVEDDLRLQADVPLELPADQIALIQDAEWAKGVVQLSIQASQLRGLISAATVISARPAGQRRLRP